MGDFNYPAIDFANHTVNSCCTSDAFHFFDKCQELCLFQHVHEFTRFRNDQQPSCLDYVFTDEDNFVQDLQYRSPLGKSDHVVLAWKITVHAEELKSYLKKYNYWKGDYSAITQHISVKSAGLTSYQANQSMICGIISRELSLH